MNTQFTSQQKPTLVNVIAWMTLASGIVNLFWGIIASITALATIVGIVCVPFTVLPTILGVFEIIYAAKLLSNPPQPVQPSTNIAIFEIITVLVGNVFSMVVGILALVFYNDLIVKDYFGKLNGIPAPVVPVTPALAPDASVDSAPEEPAPVAPEPETPAEESPSSEEEIPAKPKRTRKVAGE